MTTHLVIADHDTLDALAVEASENPAVHHINSREASLNGELWLFREPKSLDMSDVDVDFVYTRRGDKRAAVAMRSVLKQRWGPGWISRWLPLIAACDLLGVDEL